MNISQDGLDIIKSFEGCKLVAYRDSIGIATIGYGHIEGVQMGDMITQSQADQMLRDDLAEKVNGVNDLLGNAVVTQGQFDALVSFAYNCGLGNLRTSALLRMIKQGNALEAADQFLRWDKAGGMQLAGLTRRRMAEKELYEAQA